MTNQEDSHNGRHVHVITYEERERGMRVSDYPDGLYAPGDSITIIHRHFHGHGWQHEHVKHHKGTPAEHRLSRQRSRASDERREARARVR